MNRLFAGLSMGLLVAAVVAVHLWLEVGKQRESNEQLTARIAALEARRDGRMPAQVVAPQAPAAGAEATNSALGAAIAAAAGGQGEKSGLDGILQMLDTPEGREFAYSMTLMSLQQRYPDLESALGLSSEEAGKLLEILARQQTDQGVGAIAGRRGANAPDVAERQRIASERAERQRAGEAELVALLGDRYPKWQEYERAATTRMTEQYTRQAREQLRNTVATRDNPITDTAFESFSSAVDAEQRRFRQESPPSRSIQQELQRMPEMHRRMVDAASAYLDATQLDRYRRHLQQEESMARSTADMVKSMGLPDE